MVTIHLLKTLIGSLQIKKSYVNIRLHGEIGVIQEIIEIPIWLDVMTK